MAFDIFNVLLMLFLPWLAIHLTRRYKFFAKLSPVFICYAVGIVLANVPNYPINALLTEKIYQAAVLLAIPMLLFNTRFSDWSRLKGKTFLAFVIAIFSSILAALIVPFFFKSVDNISSLSGMLAGIFIGGTPNMQAVGIALNASHDSFILLNAAEIACTGIYLLLIVAGLQKILWYVLPKFASTDLVEKNGLSNNEIEKTFNWNEVLKNFFLSVAVSLIVFLLSFLFFGNTDHSIFIIIGITSVSILFSMIPSIQRLGSGFLTGEYFLLIFCTGIGLLANFKMILNNGIDYLWFATATLLFILTVHIVLCRIFKIDADNMIMSSTATIFGPAFIGQVSVALKNKELLFPGMVMSLIGLAIANYFGIAIANILKYYFGLG